MYDPAPAAVADTADARDAADPIIEINVGGEQFNLYKSLLDHPSDWYFTKLFAGDWKDKQTTTFEFKEHDPDVFRIIARWLRTGTFLIPFGIPERVVEKELLFWGIGATTKVVEDKATHFWEISSNKRDEQAQLFCDRLLEDDRLKQAATEGNAKIWYVIPTLKSWDRLDSTQRGNVTRTELEKSQEEDWGYVCGFEDVRSRIDVILTSYGFSSDWRIDKQTMRRKKVGDKLVYTPVSAAVYLRTDRLFMNLYGDKGSKRREDYDDYYILATEHGNGVKVYVTFAVAWYAKRTNKKRLRVVDGTT